MIALFTSRIAALLPGQLTAGIAKRTEILHFRSGRAWLTVEGIPQDFWLEAGDSFIVPPGRKIVIEADKSECRVEVEPAVEWTAVLRMMLNDLTIRFTRPARVTLRRAGMAETHFEVC